jgi:hypothetical protein
MDSKGAEAEIINLLIAGRLIDCGELLVAKSTLGKKRPGLRFLIYLPSNRNYLWKSLNNAKLRVRVYIELPKVASTES